MQRHGMKTLAGGVAAIVACGTWGGCSATKPTELVPGVLSQVQVPRNLAGIRLEVLADGALKFCETAKVNNGIVDLPTTLGVLSPSSTDATTTITITVKGYDAIAAQGSEYSDCGDDAYVDQSTTEGPGPTVLRRSVQTYVPGHELFVPMPLSYSCWDQDCSMGNTSTANLTCKGAQCVDDGTATPPTLVDFNHDLVYGTDLPCFDPQLCFSDAVPAVPIAGQSCTYGFLEPHPPASGLNVHVYYEDFQLTQDTAVPSPATAWNPVLVSAGEDEILSEDATEGFVVLPNQQFQLPTGLCGLAQAAANPPAAPPAGSTSWKYRVISDIQVASACAPKLPLLAFCAGDRAALYATNLASGGFTPNGSCNVPRKLLPSPSAVYLALDDTTYMQGNATENDAGMPTSSTAFGANGVATQLTSFLSNPVFSRTYLAFHYLAHDAAECTGTTTAYTTTPYTAPSIDFGLAAAVGGPAQTALTNWMPPTGDTLANPLPLELEALMGNAGAYSYMSNAVTPNGPAYNTQALMVFVNRAPGQLVGSQATLTPAPPTECNGAATAVTGVTTAAATAYQTNGIKTFFVLLNDENGDAETTYVPTYKGIQAAAPSGAVSVIDASGSAIDSLENFAAVVEPLATCLYEAPPDIDTTAQFKYTNPVAAPGQGDTVVPLDTTCNATSTTANGWNIEQVATTKPTSRIRVCGKPCNDLQNLIVQVALYAKGAGLSPIDVPITATPGCTNGDAGAPGDGGASGDGG